MSDNYQFDTNCAFCRIVAGVDDAFTVFEDEDVVSFLPLRPASLGHILLVPKIHVSDIWHLNAETGAKVMASAIYLAHALKRAFLPEGLNLINSAGEAASQSVFHFHMHLVPRWTGDPIGDLWPRTPDWTRDMKQEVTEAIRAAI